MEQQQGDQHLQKLLDLIEAEREAERAHFSQKVFYTQIKDRKKEGICWYPVVVNKSYFGAGGNLSIELSRTSDTELRHNFQGGATVQVFLNSSQKTEKAIVGVIAWLRGDDMKVVLNSDNLPDWFDEGKLGVNLMWDESTFDKMKSAVEFVMGQRKGRVSEFKSIFYGHATPQFTGKPLVNFPGLNDSQNQALQKVASARDVAIVHGPPGTGKTTTLVKIIKYTVETEKQVLACAPSNTAVDLLVEKLNDEGIRTLRIGHPARISEAVIESALDNKVTSHKHYTEIKGLRKKGEELRRLSNQYKRKFGYAEKQQRKQLKQEARRLFDEANFLERYIVQDLLNDAEVIVATLAGVDHPLLKGKTYKTVFIDEAGQALEPACWIPILRSDRVIMAGDHMQLPPTVKSAAAQKENFGYSLFERIIDQHQVDSMLTMQYRMDPTIVQWPNSYFYEGKLENSVEVLNRPALQTANLFIDTAGAGFDEEKDPETGSTRNLNEAQFVVRFLTGWLAKHKEIGNIGVIAPYRAQVEALDGLLSEHFAGYNGLLTCHTVDGFQGQERDMIIISTTRCNEIGEIGFLKDLRRINVALTRAKHALIVIGDSATLSSHPFYDQMIQFYQQQGWYQSVFEYG